MGKGVEVGPYCIVGEHVKIGARTVLLSNVIVNGYTTIGEDCRLYPFTSIGMASQDRKYQGERAFTIIGDRTTIREYVSVHRATGEDEITSVGDDCLLLAYTHIAHNCRIGNDVTMSNLRAARGPCYRGRACDCRRDGGRAPIRARRGIFYAWRRSARNPRCAALFLSRRRSGAGVRPQ